MKQYEAAIVKYKEAMDTDPNYKEYGNILRLTGLCYASLAENRIFQNRGQLPFFLRPFIKNPL
jgi:tetratricopeptide (TPR) repeat protein